jgi:hypothetical protein
MLADGHKPTLGTPGKNAEGKLAVVRVVLRPGIVFAEGVHPMPKHCNASTIRRTNIASSPIR